MQEASAPGFDCSDAPPELKRVFCDIRNSMDHQPPDLKVRSSTYMRANLYILRHLQPVQLRQLRLRFCLAPPRVSLRSSYRAVNKNSGTSSAREMINSASVNVSLITILKALIYPLAFAKSSTMLVSIPHVLTRISPESSVDGISTCSCDSSIISRDGGSQNNRRSWRS